MINIIGGTPRSGSTLLCNILNQNNKIYASSTSILPQLVLGASNILSSSPEFKAELVDKKFTEDKALRIMRAICFQWYAHLFSENKVIFDKSRMWNNNILALRTLFPGSKAIILVRDLRNVFASVEKQHRKNAALDESGIRQLDGRADAMFSPGGLIGGPLMGIKDIIDRKLPVFFIRYEDMILHPEEVLLLLYKHLDIEPMEHNLDDIKNTATDPDWMYLYKYPHVGAGKLDRELNTNEWNNYFSKDFGNKIVDSFPWFYSYFGYERG